MPLISRGLINGEVYIQGGYILNKKSALKQAIVVQIKICFAFTGF